MRIAIHSPRSSYYLGGAERYILNMALSLEKEGQEVFLITYDAPIKSEWFRKFKKSFRGKIYLVKSKELDNNFKKFMKASNPEDWDKESKIFSKNSKKIYEKEKFDIISFHYAVDCLGAPKNTKIALHLHGLPDIKRLIENKALNRPEKIIALSNYIAKGWKNLHKINKTIDISYNALINNPEKLENTQRSNDIIFFGRLIKIKGIDVLLNAIKIVSMKHNNIHLVVIGEGPDKKRLIKLTNKLGIQKNVKFLGHQNDYNLKEIIASSKISIFPSYSREGVMTTMLESSRGGSVIIASNSCSTSEFIQDNLNGILFKPKDYRDLAEKINRVLEDKILLSRLRTNSFKQLKKWYWKYRIKEIIKLYNQIITSNHNTTFYSDP